jgi:hypothetical protein
MSEHKDEKAGYWNNYAVIIAAVAILIGLMLPPVKRWLNAVPYLWTIVYPLLTLFAFFVFVKVIQDKEDKVTILKWGVLLFSALAMTVAKFGLGAPFFTIGRTLAIIFIIVELGTFIYDFIRPGNT